MMHSMGGSLDLKNRANGSKQPQEVETLLNNNGTMSNGKQHHRNENQNIRPIYTLDLEDDEMMALGNHHSDDSKHRSNGGGGEYSYHAELFGPSPQHPSPLLILIVAVASALFYSLFLNPLVTAMLPAAPGTSTAWKGPQAYEMAYAQSYGFFDDVSVRDWERMRDRVKVRQNHALPDEPTRYLDDPRAWYQNNYEPDFTCPHELRVGGMGDGPKWVCDPHRVMRHARQRRAGPHNHNGCLIYSVGSAGNFEFERGLVQTMARLGGHDESVYENECEVHVFDPEDFSDEAPEGIIFHPWGFKSSSTSPLEMGSNFKSFQETIAELGHEGRVIDIFKIDCEGCEWNIYKDFFDDTTIQPVTMLQVLIELHNSPPQALDYFDTMQNNGYVTFHKEPNIMFGGGNCQEYAFLKLAPEFFM